MFEAESRYHEEHRDERKGKLAFEVEADPFYSEANQARLRAGIAAFESGIGISEHELIEAGDEEDMV